MDSGSIESVIEAIRRDRVSGASQLARRCLGELALFAEAWNGSDVVAFRRDLLALATGIRSARPSMVVIDNLLEQWERKFDEAGSVDLEILRAAAVDAAHEVEDSADLAFEQAVANMAAEVRPGEVIMTHSLSSTVRSLFEKLEALGISTIATESRPLQEGKLLAQHLSNLQIPTRFITDAQMGVWVRKASRVVVGADAVLADGSVVNKAGTLLLALAAQYAGIPFNVCCESCKFSALVPGEFVLEQMGQEELGVDALPHVDIGNTYFDITPPELVSAWVTETGVRTRWG